MSSNKESANVNSQLDRIANAFGRDNDPLQKHESKFEKLDIDLFEVFVNRVLVEQGLADSTFEDYQRIFGQWIEFTEKKGRHPACPNEGLVKEYAHYYRDDVGNNPDTVQKKLKRLNKAYSFWQASNSFPHPKDYNPFESALMNLDLRSPPAKDYPYIKKSELRKRVKDVTHIRDQAIIASQAKLGLRGGATANVRIEDLHINNSQLQRFYPELGSNEMLNGNENAIYIPPKPDTGLPLQGRSGNKSRRPRILPLDHELRRLLTRYLLIRPDTGTPWLFLSKQKHNKLNNEAVNNIWIDAFHPEYEETDQHRGITSHYGRHWFTTYWRIEQDVNRELIKYMRGDKNNSSLQNRRSAIDDYIHIYYEDIEELYRSQIFSLDL